MKKPQGKGGSTRATTEVDRQVGADVRTLRTAQGLTLVSVSEQLGISHQQLQKYETGSNRLSAGILVRLAEILNVPLILLFDRGQAVEKRAKSPTDLTRALCHRLIDRTTSQRKLSAMAQVLKAMQDSP
ncbi:helix-turn-helix transcriptional regulator [Hyphomonas chukchiensis]|uniref:helix-turn-helix domain-containing protein n=1 Tax=Hyphomonas chukchiensis TaxID=1280947 RepID=UPI0030F659DC